MSRLIRTITVLMFVTTLVACDDDTPSTPTTPTPPVTVTETFAGSVNQNGAVTHTFSTQSSGIVTATLTTLGPDSTFILGMSLGTWNVLTTTCQVVLANDSSTQGTTITGGVSSFGSLCLRAYDVGTIPAGTPFSYEITVVHP